jgi:hypothetical protein
VAVPSRIAFALALAAVVASPAGCSLGVSGLGDESVDDDAAIVDDDVATEDASVDVADARAEAEAEAEAGADAGADAEAAADAEPDAVVSLPVVARLNLDGPALDGVDFPGHWTAAPVPGACGPNHYENGPVHGTLDPGLFTGEAFGNPLKCAIGGGSLAHGTYRVRLYFAELYWGPGCPGGGAGPGARVFSVALEGKTVLTDFDVFVATGGCLASKTSAAGAAGAPVVQTFDVIVNDGTLDLVGTPTKDNAKLSAIEVLGPL